MSGIEGPPQPPVADPPQPAPATAATGDGKDDPEQSERVKAQYQVFDKELSKGELGIKVRIDPLNSLY